MNRIEWELLWLAFIWNSMNNGEPSLLYQTVCIVISVYLLPLSTFFLSCSALVFICKIVSYRYRYALRHQQTPKWKWSISGIVLSTTNCKRIQSFCLATNFIQRNHRQSSAEHNSIPHNHPQWHSYFFLSKEYCGLTRLQLLHYTLILFTARKLAYKRLAVARKSIQIMNKSKSQSETMITMVRCQSQSNSVY